MTDIEYLRAIAQNKNLPQLMRDQISSAADEIERGRCAPARQGNTLGNTHLQEPEVLAYATHHDEPMLFPSSKEAAAYCEDGEEPVALIRLSDYETLQAECEKLRKDAELWESIHDEIHRRADKEHALADRCDFDVTIMYEDYAAIDAAMAGGDQ